MAKLSALGIKYEICHRVSSFLLLAALKASTLYWNFPNRYHYKGCRQDSSAEKESIRMLAAWGNNDIIS